MSIPLITRPNTVCLLSSHGVGTVVIKNQNAKGDDVSKAQHTVHITVRISKMRTLAGDFDMTI
jgi:hypothetical protein